MANEMSVFTHELFGNVRTVLIGDKVHFVGKDIAESLCYKEPHKAISAHCRYGISYPIPHPQSKDKSLDVIIIPEGDIYRLITKAADQSKSPEVKEKAEKFEQWIFDGVIPQIRQTGGYIPINEEDDDASIMARALLVANKTLAKKNQIIKKKDEEIAILSPKAEYHDSVLKSEYLRTTTSIAKDLSMTARQLNKVLKELDFQYKQSDTWFLKKEYQHLIPEYCDYEINEYGQLLKWTEKGRKYLISFLTNNGII